MLITHEYDVPVDEKAIELWQICFKLQKKELESVGLPNTWSEELKAELNIIDWKTKEKETIDIVFNFLKKVRTLYDRNLKPEELERAELSTKASMLNNHSPASMFAEFVVTFLKNNPIYYDTKSKIFWSWNFKNYKWEISEEVDILRVFNEKYTILEWIIPSLKMKVIDTLKVFASKKPKDAPVNLIQFKNKVYDLTTDDVFDADSEYFFTNPIPHELGECDNIPIIDKMISEWVSEKDKQAIYQIMAYCLLRSYPVQRVFVFHGEGANGKGTCLRLIRRLIGDENVTSTDYDRLADPNQRFERVKLLNKLVCQLGELEVTMFSKTSCLKELSSGTDLISGEIKGKNPFDFLNYAKIIINTNKVPMTVDKSDGFYRRFNTIDFPNQFPDIKDILAQIPNEEYPNLARKCVNVLKELLKSGEFVNDGSIENRKNRYEALSNPIRKFIIDNYDLDVNSWVLKSDLKEQFLTHLKSNRLQLINDREISQALRCCGYSEKVMKINKFSERVVIGLKLKNMDEIDLNVPVTANFGTCNFKNDTSSAMVTAVTAVTPIPNQKPHMWLSVGKVCNSCNSCNFKATVCDFEKNTEKNCCNRTKKEIYEIIKKENEITLENIIEKCCESERKEIISDLEILKKEGDVFEPQPSIFKAV